MNQVTDFIPETANFQTDIITTVNAKTAYTGTGMYIDGPGYEFHYDAEWSDSMVTSRYYNTNAVLEFATPLKIDQFKALLTIITGPTDLTFKMRPY